MKTHLRKKTTTPAACLAGGIPILALGMLLSACGTPEPLGMFEGQTNVGDPEHAGVLQYEAGQGVYRITGGGENMWDSTDAFYYAWRQVEGDVTLTTDVALMGEGKNEHRKAGWMVRGSLEPDAAYADAVVHGNGLISLQYRETAGGPTQEVQASVQAPATMRLERTGDLFTLFVAQEGEAFQPVGSITVALPETVYAGLAVCAHEAKEQETAVFSNVGFDTLGVVASEERVLESSLEIVDIETGARRIVHRDRTHFEAPNWSRDGQTLLFNSEGRLYTVAVGGGEPQMLDTGFADRCNNDHGYSPDGTQLVISHNTEDQGSMIYLLPSSGGAPRLITEQGPSYWHGWSPDGKTLAYCARRNDDYDVYTISVEGGPETRLTDAPGLDDGPDYSPDGQFIYFNSIRTGQMKIWRMRADGSDPLQITPDDDYGDWFAHPSPDGQWLVFLSYDKTVEGHPPNKNVLLRLMPTSGGEPTVLATLFGGQGTINVPSWSPDSREVAFVSYRLVTSK